MRFIAVFLVALTASSQVSSFSPIPRHSVSALTSSPTQQASGAKILAHLEHDNEDSVDHRDVSLSLAKEKKSTDPKSALELFIPTFLKNAKAKQATFMAILMLAMAPLPSNAAMSGGRIGGSFSSPRSSTPSRSSYSSPSRGYGRGYGGGAVSGFASGYASGLGAGYMSAPRFGFNPFVSPFYPRPYYGGAGIITYNPGPSLGQLVFFGGAALAISAALRSESVDMPTFEGFDGTTSVLGPGTSYAKISVALDVPNRDDPSSILSVLNRLGDTTNTASQKGIQGLTSQGECRLKSF